jgi:hypothetical protein
MYIRTRLFSAKLTLENRNAINGFVNVINDVLFQPDTDLKLKLGAVRSRATSIGYSPEMILASLCLWIKIFWLCDIRQ